MARNGSGTYNLYVPGNPVVTGTTISSTWANNTLNDIATALTNSIAKDGQTTPTANLPMGTFKLTGLGVGSAATDSVNMSQLQSGATRHLTGTAGTDTITASASPALTAYAAGNNFTFVAAGANTGATTININSVGAKTIQKNGAALIAGDILNGTTHTIVYDGTNFQLQEGAQANSLQNQSYTTFTTGGTSTAYTLTPTPAQAALTTGHRYNITFNATAGATPTLAISGLTAKSLKYYDSTGTKQAVTSTVLVANLNSDVIYDGTDYVVLNPTGVAAIAASSAEVIARSISTKQLTPSTVANITLTGTLTATTSGTSKDITGISSTAKIVEFGFSAVSTSGTSNLVFQVGTSTTPQTSGYAGDNLTASGGSLANTNATANIILNSSITAGSSLHGTLKFVLLDAATFLYAYSGSVAGSNNNYIGLVAGSVALTGFLNMGRITTAGGVDTFDAGNFNYVAI
jgi:hypothetical protein